MNIERLLKMQKELDDHINRSHPTDGIRTYKKVLALIVEIAELANETRCFKFWSNKRSGDREAILEEGADVLHFLFSIANDLGITHVNYQPIRNPIIEAQFLALFDHARLVSNKRHWEITFSLFVALMESLGYSWDELEKAYIRKNKINHERQEKGY